MTCDNSIKKKQDLNAIKAWRTDRKKQRGDDGVSGAAGYFHSAVCLCLRIVWVLSDRSLVFTAVRKAWIALSLARIRRRKLRRRLRQRTLVLVSAA